MAIVTYVGSSECRNWKYTGEIRVEATLRGPLLLLLLLLPPPPPLLLLSVLFQVRPGPHRKPFLGIAGTRFYRADVLPDTQPTVPKRAVGWCIFVTMCVKFCVDAKENGVKC